MDKMRYVHIMGSGGMFVKDYYRFISNNFSPNEHSFVTDRYDSNVFGPKNENKCQVESLFSLRGLRLLSGADCIVAHGMVSSKMLLLYLLRPWSYGKIAWIIWGGDVYGGATLSQGIKRRLIEAARRFLYRHIKLVGTVSSKDYVYAHEVYGISAAECEVTYPVPATDSSLLCSLRKETINAKKAGSAIRIQIGNSATESNHHVEALDLIAKYKNENIKVFIPLAYGMGERSSYGDEVSDYAKSIFGDKVEVLKQPVPGDEYLRILSGVDIGLFNNSRQQGMGNITQLMMFGAKVYARPDVSMWDHLSSLGCTLFDINAIESQDFSEFVRFDEDSRRHNAAIFERRHSLGPKIEQWTRFFELAKRLCSK